MNIEVLGQVQNGGFTLLTEHVTHEKLRPLHVLHFDKHTKRYHIIKKKIL